MQTNKGGVANPFVSHPLLCVIVKDESLDSPSDIIQRYFLDCTGVCALVRLAVDEQIEHKGVGAVVVLG